MPDSLLISLIATSLLAGEMEAGPALARVHRTLGRRWRWVGPVVRRYVETFNSKTRPRHRDVVRFLHGDPGVQSALAQYAEKLRVERLLTEPPVMQPVAAAAEWELPAIETVGALAEWLLLEGRELDWYSDLKGLAANYVAPQLRHYHYTVLNKRSGGTRLIEAPKTLLKQLQRQILAEILNKVPPHPAVHGFVPHRSIKTFAGPHVGKALVLRMDLRDFFPSIPMARISAFFRTAGYPEAVADRLAALCTSSVPRDIWQQVSHLVFAATSSAGCPHVAFARQHLLSPG